MKFFLLIFDNYNIKAYIRLMPPFFISLFFCYNIYMKFKKLFGFSILFASLVKLLFYTKTLKLHKNAPKYTPQKSDREYVEINNTNKDPDFRHPTTKMNPPHGRFENDDNVVRSPDGSA